MTFSCCYSLGENLDFLDFFQKSFTTSATVWTKLSQFKICQKFWRKKMTAKPICLSFFLRKWMRLWATERLTTKVPLGLQINSLDRFYVKAKFLLNFMNDHFFKKMGHPRPLFRLFSVFSNKNFNFNNYIIWRNVHTISCVGIRTHDFLNSILLP